jgi:hypothetical protein
MALKRRLKDFSKSAMRKLFELGQRLGFDALPRHFYSEIPNIRQLRRTAQWRRPYSMIGVEGADALSQIAFVRECCTPAIVERLGNSRVHEQASQRNGESGFGVIEADFLFAFVAAKKPKQIFQIGCGVSTAVCLLAADHAGYVPEIICVEPYPTYFLVGEALQGRIKLLQEKAEMLDLGIIESLGDDLLFFVDSSHTLGPAGEVTRIVLEMLPRLKPGAWVHFHDIWFPYDYPPDILDTTLFFWHESALLHAFLTHNSRFRIAASLSILHYAQPEQLRDCLPNYARRESDDGLAKGEGHFPASTYLRVIT